LDNSVEESNMSSNTNDAEVYNQEDQELKNNENSEIRFTSHGRQDTSEEPYILAEVMTFEDMNDKWTLFEAKMKFASLNSVYISRLAFSLTENIFPL